MNSEQMSAFKAEQMNWLICKLFIKEVEGVNVWSIFVDQEFSGSPAHHFCFGFCILQPW